MITMETVTQNSETATMSSIEEQIPAFSMWKMFNETVPFLLKSDCSENSVRRLANIIQSKEFSNIFVYSKEPSITFAQYQEMVNKYKSFTTWLLGQFFYLISCDKLLKIHDVIIDAQICILEQLSKTQLHVYGELTNEYNKAFNLLIDYYKGSNLGKITLEVFIPTQHIDLNEKLDLSPAFISVTSKSKCLTIVNKLIKFLKYILAENFLFFSFDNYSYRTVENLAYLLSDCPFEIKLEIFEIYVDILKKARLCHNDYDVDMIEKIRRISSIFEQVVYDVYNKTVEVSAEELNKFEKVLMEYFKTCQGFSSELTVNASRLHRFIYKESLESTQTSCEEIRKICAKNVRPLYENSKELETLIVRLVETNNDTVFYSFKDVIFEDVVDYQKRSKILLNKDIAVYDIAVSQSWNIFNRTIIDNLEKMNCTFGCKIEDFLRFFNSISRVICEIQIEWKKNYPQGNTLKFFDEPKLFFNFFRIFAHHLSNNCDAVVCVENCFQFFINSLLVCNSNNIDKIFHILVYPFLVPLVYNSSSYLPDNFIGTVDLGAFKTLIRSFYKFLASQDIEKRLSLQYLIDFFVIISSGLMTNLNGSHIEVIEGVYMKISVHSLASADDELKSLVIDSVPYIVSLFANLDKVFNRMLLPIFRDSSDAVRLKASRVVPTIFCTSSGDYVKVLNFNGENKFFTEIICDKCTLEVTENINEKEKIKRIETLLEDRFNGCAVAVSFRKNRFDLASANILLSFMFMYEPTNLKLAALDMLPVFANHMVDFHCPNATLRWLPRLEDENKEVRKKFATIIYSTIKSCQESKVVSVEKKQEILNLILITILHLTKKSLQYSDFELQDTLLMTIDEIGRLKSDRILIECLKILIYLIMIPTSKHSMIAINKCFKLAKTHDTNMMQIYAQNRQELCEIIVNLCAVNQALVNNNLATSLKKVAVLLGFYGAKDFVAQESSYLLPFFVAKVVKMPAVAKLIEEMTALMELDISELLSSKYGNIFLHVFLNESSKGDFKQCMTYLEKTTGMSGPTLRKSNFRVILNELLLNFHEKKDRVLLALSLLAKEDSENASTNIPDYLQSQFLGILLYFGIKLIAKNTKKDKILLSLADIFRFMGPKHIVPLRFKIIAMLQTADYDNFPQLNCEVWDAFIRSCDMESLGPQLATIFVSVLPLMQYCPAQVNDIFKYLLVANEAQVKEFIPDLFFVNNVGVDFSVLAVIKKYATPLDGSNLKHKIRLFLKYLSHENTEVRIQSLNHLKICMEKGRNELDQMILGYNGIDPTIVELIDILTLGCREKDEALKLACGEVIGELGAVEPSHLPRRYVQDNKSFIFFIYEDFFIISALNELIKAFQTDKNTQNMDRFALAIQEILKTNDISPDPNNSKNYLWEQFPQSQKEVMLPLLSSRYMMAQPVNTNFSCPIYGSSLGASFQEWLYNWTCSLIVTLPNERKSLLQVCLPSMRQDNRILMHFLPHILLHSLLESGQGSEEKCHTEFVTITNSFVNRKQLDSKTLNVRPLPIPGTTAVSQTITPEEVKQMQCIKVVFLLLDFLDRWVREWQWQKGLAGRNNENFLSIKNFQNRFCKLQLAKCNYHCGEYPRALMYLEDYISDNPNEISSHLTFLAEIYAQLEEEDGVAGVTALQHSEPSVEERILALEVSGKLADAAACYERISHPLKLHHVQGLVQCYLDLDNVNTALNFAQGALDHQPEFGNMLLEMQAEPLWRLGRYDDLDDLLHKPDLSDNRSWGVQIGRALLHFKNGDRNEFKTVLDALRKHQVESLGAASLEEGAYQHGYGYISRLHALNELQQIEKTVYDLLVQPNDRNIVQRVMEKLMVEWELRIKVVQKSVRIIEPLLCLRRVGLDLGWKIVDEKVPLAFPFFRDLLGESWLISAKIARAAGVHQQAYTYTLKAEEFAPEKLFLEKAKLHWLREEHEHALTTLRRGLELVMPSSAAELNALDVERKKILAEAKLLIASYNDAISNVDTDMNIQYYKEAFEVFREWEKSLVCLGQYLDRVFQNLPEEERDSKGSDIQIHMINYFGKSLQYGTKYVYQSMPRLLSIWFDYGTRLLDVTLSSVKEERKSNLLKMTKLIDTYLERLPAFVFLTAFSQLVSRICHPQKEVYLELKSIIIKLLQHYPQQSLWTLISVIKSSYAIRSRKCGEILNDPRLKNSTMSKLVKDFTSLAEKLIELCNREVPLDVNTVSVSALLRTLPRMLQSDNFSEIMMPTHKFRKLILPNPDFKSSQHNPFPNHNVHIVGIEDEMTILQSLQHPRKITLRGSDGKGYIFMLKPKDDLRKDFRLMEFNDIVNQLLAREPEARQRRLNIRLYSVAPLNEECGLIEWVPNLIGLRPVLMSLYKQRGLGMKGKELKEACCSIRDPLSKKRDVFTKQLLPKHPPVLGEWFKKTFPDAQSWLTARTAYTRTTAVMSMAGYILGLGDRHGENILLDSTCGDAVHVDFNCLFNKGESFEWPERVPFRLTQNMVAAMGPLGVEGVFRKSCACTLRVLRTNATTLMSIVTPFVYDPLVSWPRNVPGSSHANAERTNEQAVEHLKNIELRLQGVIKTRTRQLSIPLSVEGQTNNLINEAISDDNLCQMYIGWGPYL